MVAGPITLLLSTDAGHEFPASVRHIRTHGSTVRSSVEIDGSIWSRLLDQQSFHCSPSTLGPDTLEFAADAIVTLDLQLAPVLTPGVLAVDPTAGLVGAMLGDPAPSVLHRCSSWYLRACTAPIELDGVELDPGESVSEGFRTAWGAHPDRHELSPVGFVAEHLDRRGWSVSPLDGVAGFTWELTGTHTAWTATVLTDVEERRVTIYSVLADVVPSDRRDAALARLNAANLGLLAGSWELTALGTVRLRSAAELGDALDPGTVIARTVDQHLDTFDALVGDLLDLVR